MYRVQKVFIRPGDELYEYCQKITSASNNLYNAVLFRYRQVLTATQKSKESWTSNEQEVMKEIEDAVPKMRFSTQVPTKGKHMMGYSFMDALLKLSRNPDYLSSDIPRQSAQHVIKEVHQAMKSFYAVVRAYKKNPDSFTGKPKLPGYRKSGGMHVVILTNQDCVLTETEHSTFAKLPLTKTRCEVGKVCGRLKQATITPYHDVFILSLTLDDGKEEPSVTETPKRICSIDLGVSNFASITNNAGLPCLLFKGGVVKSINQLYNKKLAAIMSAQTKGTTKKFVPTPESKALYVKRMNRIMDFMHKTGKYIISWCVKNRIDTIVVGSNVGWKQKANMGAKNNQEFVEIPFDKFKAILEYLAAREGIRVVRQEESYTSKASFLDNDPIPVYREGDKTEYKFSGRRGPTNYNGHRKTLKKDGSGTPGFRGLYKSSDGRIINSDLNGSANIGRKAFPEMYSCGSNPDFNRVIVIKHPDYDNVKKERAKQLKANNTGEHRTVSKAKARRDARKRKEKM